MPLVHLYLETNIICSSSDNQLVSYVHFFQLLYLKDTDRLNENVFLATNTEENVGKFFFPGGTHFFPPQPHNPLTKPVIPAPVVLFLFSILSTKEGKLIWLRAKSKKSGLQGTGTIVGGNLITFGVFVVKLASSTNSSSRRDKL